MLLGRKQEERKKTRFNFPIEKTNEIRNMPCLFGMPQKQMYDAKP